MSYRTYGSSASTEQTFISGDEQIDSTDPIRAAAQAQRIVADLSLVIDGAEAAVSRARYRGIETKSMDETAKWIRSSLEELRSTLATTPAQRALPEVRVRAEQIAETATALRALAERSGR